MIRDCGHTGQASAIGAAEVDVVRLDAMPNNSDSAVIALGSERMNCALEAVERVCLASHHNLKRAVVVVTASVALRHDVILVCCRR